jgi:hypothetical protein
MSKDTDSTKHYGAVLLAMCALSSLSMLAAERIGDVLQVSTLLAEDRIPVEASNPMDGADDEPPAGSRYSAYMAFTDDGPVRNRSFIGKYPTSR